MYAMCIYCIRYLQCENGIPTEKLCPDGLFFNSKASIFSYPCQYPPEVDCEGRTQLRKFFKDYNSYKISIAFTFVVVYTSSWLYESVYRPSHAIKIKIKPTFFFLCKSLT